MNKNKFRVWCKVSNTLNYDWQKIVSSHYNYRDEKYPEGIDATEDALLVFQQFTGLKDCEDREIFVGDILENLTAYEEYCSPAVVVEAKYEYVGFSLAYKYKGDKFHNYKALIHEIDGIELMEEFQLSRFGCYKVIGNIFESKALLRSSASENLELLK